MCFKYLNISDLVMFNDDWMREMGYLNQEVNTAEDLLPSHKKALVSVRAEELLSHAVVRFRKHQVAQMPVMDQTGLVGSLSMQDVFEVLANDASKIDHNIRMFMGAPYKPSKNSISHERVFSTLCVALSSF